MNSLLTEAERERLRQRLTEVIAELATLAKRADELYAESYAIVRRLFLSGESYGGIKKRSGIPRATLQKIVQGRSPRYGPNPPAPVGDSSQDSTALTQH
ncbi:hypothetical protein BKG82_27265 [Mycobacteroides chelonae]|uniref:Uncharacterized protein n=1 Tax=Mycobacteroides chelonae TaxID=1774 RepID=A0A1S1LCG9_MYCCH|nr:hypothetical protein [Mycobacteroides chelonae]OHU47353.1 hypothetical protein BKG82_27265 [Mycobacteroides chelonae]